MHIDDASLRDFLIDSGILSRRQLAEVGDHAEALYQTLLKRSVVSHDELRRAAAAVLGVPFVVLERETIELEALPFVPEPIARTHSIIAYKRRGPVIEVALLDLDALDEIDFLWHEKDLQILPRLTTIDSIKRSLMLYHKHLKETYGERLRQKGDPDKATDALLAHALIHRASEVYLSPREFLSGQGEILVRYRIEGRLYDAMTLPREASAILSRLKELAHVSLTLSLPQEGSFKVAIEGTDVRVRVSTLLTSLGENVVLHLVPQRPGAERKGFSLHALGFHGGSLERMHQALHKKSGLILVGGLSGKTTLGYTLLDLLATPERVAMSVEENIASHLPHVLQSAARPEIGLDIAGALRAVTKQDPDVVLVDAVRESGAASIAANAAAAGKLVIAIVDAPDAAGAIEKFLSFGVPRSLLARVLRASVGVAVAGRVCHACKEEYKLSRVESEPFEPYADFGNVLASLKEEGMTEADLQWKDLVFARAVGCSECEGGFKGNVGLQEVLLPSLPIQEALKEGGGRDEIAQLARKEGMQTLIEDGLFKSATGLTSISEISIF